MSASPQFTATPNNALAQVTNADSLETLDWLAGASGGRLHQILVRVVADQAVTISVNVKVGASILPIVRVVPPRIAIADASTSEQPPVDLLNGVTFPGLAQTSEGRALTFESGDGVRLNLLTTLNASETVTMLMLGGDF